MSILARVRWTRAIGRQSQKENQEVKDMVSEKMASAFNELINAELHSAYLYLGMAAYFDGENLPGFAHWMRIQAQEEVGHAMRFFKYLVERRAAVALKDIPAPPPKWPSPLAAFQEAYKHETAISGKIHKLADMATAERDHPTVSALRWFVDEQVEEESHADAVVQKLTMVGSSSHGLYMLDRELGGRSKG